VLQLAFSANDGSEQNPGEVGIDYTATVDPLGRCHETRKWNILLQRQGTSDTITVCTVQRPLIDATPADFGLSLVEGRQILAALEQLVAQDQINAYDRLRRNSRECGSYRRIKDWRSRTCATAIGKIRLGGTGDDA